jgi:hypothetical protein
MNHLVPAVGDDVTKPLDRGNVTPDTVRDLQGYHGFRHPNPKIGRSRDIDGQTLSVFKALGYVCNVPGDTSSGSTENLQHL